MGVVVAGANPATVSIIGDSNARSISGNALPGETHDMPKSHEDGTPLADQPPETTVRQDSDRLFDELSKLKRLETEKQQTMPTTPDFHRMAERVDRQASEVVKAAQDELEHGHEAAREHEADDEASVNKTDRPQAQEPA